MVLHPFIMSLLTLGRYQHMSAPRGTADDLCVVTLSQKFSDDFNVAYAIALTHRSLLLLLMLTMRQLIIKTQNDSVQCRPRIAM